MRPYGFQITCRLVRIGSKAKGGKVMSEISGQWKDYLAPTTAREIIAAERENQEAKTIRLREARLAKEALA
jgi:hypothetical protein